MICCLKLPTIVRVSQHCDQSKAVERAPRKILIPRIYYGTGGSANEVVKGSKTRDKLRMDSEHP
jgi:hypothetical protein